MPLHSLTEIESIERQPPEERLTARSTLELLLSAVERNADRLAIRFVATGEPEAPVHDLTYREFGEHLIWAANLFRSLGLDETSCASSLLPLVPEAFVAMFAAQAAGRANPINYLLEPAHIAALLREAGCRILLAPDPDVFPGVWDKVEAMRPDLPAGVTVLRVGGPASRPGVDALHWESALAEQPGHALAFTRDIQPEDTASLFHTGGTTSAPKLARHTHRGLVQMAWANAAIWRAGPEEVFLHGLPPFHVGGANCSGLSPLSEGATLVLMTAAGLRDRSVVRNFWAHVERFRPTVIPMVPTSWGAVMTVPVEDRDISSIRPCHAGGSAMPIELARTVVQTLGAPVVEGWGMTELHGFGTMNPGAGECRIGSVGLRVPYTEVVTAAVAENRISRRLGPGEIGRVLVRGHQVFAGYTDAAQNRGAWIEPALEETVPAWSPGGRWLDTGDLGRFDEDGYLWLTGRSKDVIIRSGHNIDPATIEEPLYRHPAVQAVAAVGRPDAYAGELPVAFVQLKDGLAASADELLAFLTNEIAERAAIPAEITIVSELPVTGVGKIYKPALRMRAAEAVFGRIVASEIGAEKAYNVTVEAHPAHGYLVTISLPENAATAAVDALRRELARYNMAHAVATHPAS